MARKTNFCYWMWLCIGVKHLLPNPDWYGSDKIAQNHQITMIYSALFAMKTNLSNPLYSIDSESKKLHD